MQNLTKDPVAIQAAKNEIGKVRSALNRILREFLVWDHTGKTADGEPALILRFYGKDLLELFTKHVEELPPTDPAKIAYSAVTVEKQLLGWRQHTPKYDLFLTGGRPLPPEAKDKAAFIGGLFGAIPALAVIMGVAGGVGARLDQRQEAAAFQQCAALITSASPHGKADISKPQVVHVPGPARVDDGGNVINNAYVVVHLHNYYACVLN